MTGETVEVDQQVLFSLVSCRAFVRERARAGDEEAQQLDELCDALADARNEGGNGHGQK